jgi:hypothetical protein
MRLKRYIMSLGQMKNGDLIDLLNKVQRHVMVEKIHVGV